jgi:outer membrane protein OmpA-like peptidoglycan-associated protein/opacity protein-like surface antigen
MNKRLLLLALLSCTLASQAQIPTNAWKFSFGGTFPRLISADLIPDDYNYGGFVAIERDFSEHTGLRLRGNFQSMTADNPAFTNVGQRVRTNMAAGNADIVYRIMPGEPVIPYVTAGVGGYYFELDTKIPVERAIKNGDYDYQFNLGFGAEWRLTNTLALITDFGYHTTSASRLDGFRGVNGGFLGARNDAYMAFNIGLSFTLWQGPASHLNDAYVGIKVPEPEHVDYVRIESIVKENTPPPEKVDYAKIEEMIRSNKPVIRQPERLIIEKKAPVAFEMINFASGSAKLDKEAINSLNRALAILSDNTDLVVELQGHTDNVGSIAINRRLSEQRATAVRQYLKNKGIAEARLKVNALETTDPVGDNATPEGRAMNRRVELKILNK